MKLGARLVNAQQASTWLREAFDRIKPALMEGRRFSVEIRPETRSTAQNRILWSILGDLSAQLTWLVDGQHQRLTDEEWKDILTADLAKHQRVAAGLNGGFVLLGRRTSKMGVAEVSELIELAHAFGSLRGVAWSRTSMGRDVPDEAVSGSRRANGVG